MEKMMIKAIPRNGSWEELYERVRSKKGRPEWIELKVTSELFGDLYDYDGIWEAKQKKFLSIEARMNDDGTISLMKCVQQNYGDEDGFGVEPDDYLGGLIGRDGYFIKPLYVY